MWNLATQGPSQYTTFVATINANNNRETVGSVANKLRNYANMISGPMQAHVSAMVKELKEEFKEEMREMKKEVRKINVAPVQVTGLKVRAQHPPARERGYTPRADLWSFLCDHGEDMGRWYGKPTSVLAAQVHQLKEGNTEEVPDSHDRVTRYYRKEDDLSDPLEGTSSMYAQEENYNQGYRGPASSQEEAQENWVFWMVWIRWPGTSEPQKI
ncbi:hypothetical protein DUI87_29597 [Hirundo rustica rustica]|uniref:Uncharacterized protein n=1 Tax=Hirundo rustica rustica TaxID=333673 RepID=A0A3M0J5H6_HIRRU|nr:hypothetical protein DUI87_29597 [Hirundo rustica rustica]